MTTETFPAQVRSALLVGVLAGRERLSITEQRRFRALAWQVCPCTCGSGPDGEGHTAWCLNGYAAQTPEPLPPELLKRLAARVSPADRFFGGFTRGGGGGVCPLCLHQWRRHDPEDGCCDAHSNAGLGPCECGRSLEWMQSKNALMSRASNERTDMPDYPHPDGDTTVLGPEIFAANDGSVICWRGQNYVPQETPNVPEAADDA